MVMARRWFWLYPLAAALGIFWLSSQSQYPAGIQLPPPLDKVAHTLVFGTLAWLLDWALQHQDPRWPLYRRHLWVFFLISLYGASDEWHQHFVPGRSCELGDWLADSFGAALGIAFSTLPLLFSRRLKGLTWQRGKAVRPDASAPLILVADPHWAEELVGLETATRAHPEADWLFLGDVFDVWVGLPGMETKAQRAFLTWVDERRRAGKWVGLWMGNREYFLDKLARHFDFMGEGIGGALEREALLWEHGDLINTKDRPYRLWNLLSRSGPLWVAFRVMPSGVANRFSRWLELKLHTTNATYKLTFPRKAFRAAAQNHPNTTFLTGHFHTHEQEANGTALPWAHEGQFMVWRNGKVEPL